MKSMVKKILLAVVVVVCCGAVLVGGAWCSAQKDGSPCTAIQIVVKDSMERQFVQVDELEGYLKRHRVCVQGFVMEQVDCHAVEQCLLSHDMVRSAECYKSPFGVVRVEVTQRVPVLCVMTVDGCYYVDSDRRVMPARKSVDVDLPVFRGAVSERAAREEYYDFVEWLQSNHYWRELISDVYVQQPKHLLLSQRGQKSKIVLGALDGYADKLSRLRTLFTHGLDEIEHPEYREYDLRFDGQVVGRK